MSKKSLMTLCPCCRQNLQNTGIYSVRRADPLQFSRDICTLCQSKYGLDYYVEPLRRRAKTSWNRRKTHD
jgi:hypothetical protein